MHDKIYFCLNTGLKSLEGFIKKGGLEGCHCCQGTHFLVAEEVNASDEHALHAQVGDLGWLPVTT